MIHKPLYGHHPTGKDAYELIRDYSHQVAPRHLRADEKKIEGNYFIPEPWRMRGYLLSPNITNQGLLFRGQTVDWDGVGEIPSAISKLQKIHDDKVERIYWRLRRFDLHNMLMTNPLFRMLSWGIDIPLKKQRYFRSSSTTLLHSYGLPSACVSLTSSLSTALFYAVNDYDEESGTFVPSKKKYGILSFYRLEKPFTPLSKVLPIGLQVFERPGRNKEFVCRLGPNDDFNKLDEVEGFLFEQSEEVSKWMLDKFDGGRRLMPPEPLLQDKIKKSEGMISPTALRWHEKMRPYFQEGLEDVKAKYQVTDDVRDLLRFDRQELAAYYGDIDEWWMEFCSKIYFEADSNLDRKYFEQLPQDNYYRRFFDWLRV